MIASSSTEQRQVPELLAAILARRGMEPALMHAFIYPEYERDLHDPFGLLDMELAVERIVLAADRGEQVVVYGDYDIDGITASAVMLEGLAALGVRAQSYIPDRFEEGYGINIGALHKLKQDGADLVISVDCGITSVSEAAWAREHGLDLIITDHHSVPEVLPEAVAVINPKRPGDEYPCKDLAGVGVAFKLIQALQAKTGKPKVGHEKWLLDLVALGTVCDVVTLAGENRVLTSFGLRVMRRGRRVGLMALAEVAGVDIAGISAHHLGYVLGPRMNAAGRLEHASRSLELVMTHDPQVARRIARELDDLNQQRRADQDRIFEEAQELACQYENDPVLVLARPDWSHGVVGIVASKLVEKYRKPVLVAQVLGDRVKGSARSVGGFNMVEALRANAQFLERFGGHFFAAGYTLPVGHLEEFRQGMNKFFIDSDAAAMPEPEQLIDLEYSDLDYVNWDLIEQLELLEPYGSGNPRPVFRFTDLQLEKFVRMGKQQQHLRCVLRDEGKQSLTVVGFGLAQKCDGLKIGSRVLVTGELNKNEFQGISSIQMIAKEISFE